MLRRWLLYGAAAAALVLTVAGCGGDQNPFRVGSQGTAFWNGLWDGFMILVGLLAEAFAGHKYGIYDVAHQTKLYDLGLTIGAFVFFGLIAGGIGRRI